MAEKKQDEQKKPEWSISTRVVGPKFTPKKTTKK